MNNKIDWQSVPLELREVILKAIKKVTYDMATDARDYDAREMAKDIMSVFFAVGQVCSDVRQAQVESLESAAQDCGESIESFIPVSKFEPFNS